MREDGRIARLLREGDRVGYRHLRFREGGAVTAAFRKLPIPVNEDVLQMAFSFCNPTDQFSRVLGRDISYSRLEHSGVYRIAVKVRHTLEETLAAGLDLLRERKKLPTWLVRLAETTIVLEVNSRREKDGEGLAAQAQ